MKKQLQITVAKPCHENWDKMSKTEQGKFCGSCQKQVVDFSSMSDRQLAAFFKKPSNGSLCGRFMSDQLDRSIDIPKKRIPWLKYFFSMLMPAFIISKVSAQTKIMGKVARPVRDTTKTCISDERRTMGIVAPSIEPFQKEFIVKGKIVDENGEPIPFVAIEAGKTMSIFYADKNGAFSMNGNLLPDNKTIQFSSRGYETKEMVILNYKEPLTIILKHNGDVMDLVSSPSYIIGEIAITNPDKPQKDTTYINIDQVIDRDIVVPDKMNKFYVFPNPVKSGGFVGLGVQMLEAGSYNCQFLDMSGKLVQQKEISIDPESRLMNIETPKVPAGNYLFVLVNKKSGKQYSEKIIVQ